MSRAEELLAFMGIHKCGITRGAHEMDPSGKEITIPVMIEAIKLYKERRSGTKAGDYYDDCLEAALNCSYVWT